MPKHIELTADIKVRTNHSGYVTSRCEGKSASCTAGPQQAAERLGAKLFGNSLVTVSALPSGPDTNVTHWRLHAEPVFAWCWQSGLIEFGRVVPEGALRFATGLDVKLQELVGVLARHGLGKSKGKLLVPGIPEAASGTAKVDALIEWTKWCARRNGQPDVGGVVFSGG